MKTLVGYVEKKFTVEHEEKKPVGRAPCQLRGKFRGLAYTKCNLSTQKHGSFVLIIFHISFLI